MSNDYNVLPMEIPEEIQEKQLEEYDYLDEEVGRASPLNQDEIIESRCFCQISSILKHGKVCCQHCLKTREELLEIFKAKRILQGYTKPEDLIPKSSLLVINEKNGRGLHSFDNRTGKKILYGNIEYACRSCNKIYYLRKSDITGEQYKTAGYTAIKSQRVRNKFKNKCLNTFAKLTESSGLDLCHNNIIEKYSSSGICNCDQGTLEKAYRQERGIMWYEFKLEDFPEQYPEGICDQLDCDGTHFVLMDNADKFKKPKTDFEVHQQEKIDEESNKHSHE